jgi:adiponectin receptor
VGGGGGGPPRLCCAVLCAVLWPRASHGPATGQPRATGPVPWGRAMNVPRRRRTDVALAAPAAGTGHHAAAPATPAPAVLLCGCRSRCLMLPPLLAASDAPGAVLRPGVGTGYRGHGWSWKQCALSALTLHNETVNIHSHLLPAMFFAFRAAAAVTQLLVRGSCHDDSVSGGHWRFLWLFEWSSLLFLCAATVVHGCSAVYHCFGALSAASAAALLKLDLGGIGLFMLACMINGVLVGFSCAPHLQQFYLCTLCSVGSVALVAPFTGRLSHPQLVRVYVGVTLCGLVPAVHWLLGVARWEERWIFGPRILLFFALLGVGLLFYLSRWPESRWPGRFDVLGASHQWWHLCVTLAAFHWWDTLMVYRDYVLAHPCPPSLNHHR